MNADKLKFLLKILALTLAIGALAQEDFSSEMPVALANPTAKAFYKAGNTDMYSGSINTPFNLAVNQSKALSFQVVLQCDRCVKSPGNDMTSRERFVSYKKN